MAKICIDPGHYGKYNRSPGVPAYYESEVMWKLANLQKKYLEEMGHTVILTRTNPNKDLDLIARGKKSKGCDLFISDHRNAVGNGSQNRYRWSFCRSVQYREYVLDYSARDNLRRGISRLSWPLPETQL